MRKNREKGIQIPVDFDEFEKAQDYVEDLLEHASVSSQIASESMAVFESMLCLILMQGFGRETTLDISGERRLGNFSIKIGFDGQRFNPADDGEGGTSPELRIIEGFGEKVSHSYHRGYNVVRIAVRTTPELYLVSCGTSILLAIATYLVICLFMDANARQALQTDYVFPIENLFGNALLMIGPPVTLLSLLKNISDVFIASERSADSHRLWVKAIATSLFAIFLAVILSIIFYGIYYNIRGYYSDYATEVVDHSFAAVVTSMVPASIFEPFETISPIPLVLLSAIVTYALCHASTYFDKLKVAIDACYELFSWMLRAVVVALPFFCYLAFLDSLLDLGFVSLAYILRIVFVIMVCCFVLFITYTIRIRAKGVKVSTFVNKLRPLLLENFAIGSAIDAVPFNIRFCAKNFGMNREKLSQDLPILAQLSLDGNCFILMLIAMTCIFMLGDTRVPWVNVVAIAALVLFLELGAPNQPGGILVGTLIIITYLNLPSMLRMAIYFEVFFGNAQNIINVISNIVTMVEEEGVHYDE